MALVPTVIPRALRRDRCHRSQRLRKAAEKLMAKESIGPMLLRAKFVVSSGPREKPPTLGVPFET